MNEGFLGGVPALLYFLFFQVCGILLVSCFLKEERLYKRLILGSAAGSLLLMWMPVLFAFLFGFSGLSHTLGGVLLAAVTGFCVYRAKPSFSFSKALISRFIKTELWIWLPLGLWCVFAYLVLHSFRVVNGEIWSSQCTYGDMSMHFGFITSIAEQKTFPPQYSILPGTKLSYPFLSDSISSSLYLLGAPLRLAYCLPMLFAGAQVFFGAWLFFREWLQDKAKAALAMVLFFLNGGFGFAYFLTDLKDDLYNFTRIFTAFYETPTNYVEENIRWVNVIVDMMVPQRATLFGWAALFPVLYILYRAVHKNCEKYFLPAALWAGAMVMVHTHSFLALGLICGVWLFFVLAAGVLPAGRTVRYAKKGAWVLLLLPVCVSLLIPDVFKQESALWLYLVIAAAAAFVVLLAVLLVCSIMHGKGKALLKTWGVFFAAVLLLALPQLITWTFTQTSGDSFVRGWFNWANLSDNYIWFYLVNIGVTAIIVLPALFTSHRRIFCVAVPACVIWFICEFVVFQPNTYDNNKLLYPAYFLLCGAAANYLTELYRKLKGLPARRVLAAGCIVLCTLSAGLTIAREAVAGYCLFGRGQLAAAEFIQENTEPGDTVLTDQRHNNEIAALTGRNIVCGSTSYVYFHGLDYYERQGDIALMYSNPRACEALFELYSVDYLMVSAYEQNNYSANEAEIEALFPCVYDWDGVRIYALK